MNIVRTTYQAPGVKGPRVRATGHRGAKNINRAWDHSLTDAENHKSALLAFITANAALPTQWQGGAQEDGSYIWMANPAHVFGTL